MVKVWKIEELASFKTVNGSKVNLSDEEKNTILNEWNTEEQKKSDNKIVEIKSLRNQKLAETDFYSLEDVTMPDNIKTWRQSLRDIPQNYTTEEEYDLLLARDEQGNLTHTVWTKPS